MSLLNIENLCVSLDGKKLLTDINMSVERGARHLLAGHNGSGKSTLVAAITGNPAYTIDSGKIFFNDSDITNENATTRSLMGIFVGAQNVPAHFPVVLKIHPLVNHVECESGCAQP